MALTMCVRRVDLSKRCSRVLLVVRVVLLQLLVLRIRTPLTMATNVTVSSRAHRAAVHRLRTPITGSGSVGRCARTVHHSLALKKVSQVRAFKRCLSGQRAPLARRRGADRLWLGVVVVVVKRVDEAWLCTGTGVAWSDRGPRTGVFLLLFLLSALAPEVSNETGGRAGHRDGASG